MSLYQPGFGPGFNQPSTGGGGPVLTLRDQIAIAAMASLTQIYWEVEEQYNSGEEIIKCQAETAYQMADAMLEARNK